MHILLLESSHFHRVDVPVLVSLGATVCAKSLSATVVELQLKQQA